MSRERGAFPVDFNVDAFFSAIPATLKQSARNGKSHLKILKAQGRSLQNHLASTFALQLTGAQALDIAARSYGFSGYNHAREVLLSTPRTSARSPASEGDNMGARWAGLANVCEEGGYVLDGYDIFTHLEQAQSGVVTALNMLPKLDPAGWYTGVASRYSKKAYNGKGNFVLWTEDPHEDSKDTVTLLIERARRLAGTGVKSYLLLQKCNISDSHLVELLSSRQQFTPIVLGYVAACTGEEGIPRCLWDARAYSLFLSETESTSVLRETMSYVAKALAVSEECALNLLISIPDDKFLRIPPKPVASFERF